MELRELLTKLQLICLRIDDARDEVDKLMKEVALKIQEQEKPHAAGTRSR